MSRLPLKDSNLGKVHGVGINDAEYCVTKHEVDEIVRAGKEAAK